jgi:hypothetical protein
MSFDDIDTSGMTPDEMGEFIDSLIQDLADHRHAFEHMTSDEADGVIGELHQVMELMGRSVVPDTLPDEWTQP